MVSLARLLQHLGSLTSAGRIRVRQCDQLRNLTGLDSISTLSDLTVESNAKLTSISAVAASLVTVRCVR